MACNGGNYGPESEHSDQQMVFHRGEHTGAPKSKAKRTNSFSSKWHPLKCRFQLKRGLICIIVESS